MLDPFFIALREALQSAFFLSLLLFFPPVIGHRGRALALCLGAAAGLLTGFPAGYLPVLNKNLFVNETWTFWRFISETILFYLSVVLAVRRPRDLSNLAVTGLFLFGFLLVGFQARSLGFLIHDMGAMQTKTATFLAAGLSGIFVGLLPIVLFKKFLHSLPLGRVFSLPSLFMTLGALQFAFGGVNELERENILVPLQRGLLVFLGEGMQWFQTVLMLTDHPFLEVPGAGLARYLSGDRMALGLTMVFMTAPPVFILTRLFSRPDPLVSEMPVAAHRRQTIAFFRTELLSQAVPVLTVFIVLVVQMHAVNISLNPLYDPAPVPLRDDANENLLRIPMADKLGDFTDKKLRKYVYYHGNKQIVFITILKPDSTVGVALDECEICRPADWNVAAKGYAQKGEHLICKYCMTPIAAATVNNPGGCNPIPISFRVEDDHIVLPLPDLIGLYQKVQELEKKGTHL